MFTKFSVGLTVLALSAPAFAQQAPNPSPTPAAQPAAEKKICHRDTPTGSFMPGKPVCHTKAEWNAIDRANGDNAKDVLTRRNPWSGG